jgi:large subunit ribosomal protein L30
MAIKESPAKKRAAQPEPKPKQLRIRLVRSVIGRPRKQREVVKGLGLRRLNSQVVRQDSPEIWGMINLIPHLLEVEELE